MSKELGCIPSWGRAPCRRPYHKKGCDCKYLKDISTQTTNTNSNCTTTFQYYIYLIIDQNIIKYPYTNKKTWCGKIFQFLQFQPKYKHIFENRSYKHFKLVDKYNKEYLYVDKYANKKTINILYKNKTIEVDTFPPLTLISSDDDSLNESSDTSSDD